jgi:uncharacterized protein
LRIIALVHPLAGGRCHVYDHRHHDRLRHPAFDLRFIVSLLVQFLIGLLFGSGLVVAGMSDPAKVQNFLDVAAILYGGWDPSLAFVMGAGTLVTYLGYRLVLKRKHPIFDSQFHLPKAKHIDAPIVIGPAIFGIGWGLGGFCPGPAFIAVGTGSGPAMIFVVAMVLGMVAARFLALKQINSTAPDL